MSLRHRLRRLERYYPAVCAACRAQPTLLFVQDEAEAQAWRESEAAVDRCGSCGRRLPPVLAIVGVDGALV